MMRVHSLALAIVALAFIVWAAPVAGQEDRAGLIQEARLTGDESARRDLYMEAANPTQMDSLWAVSVYEIAQIMRDLGQDSVAATWIRWVTRHGEWVIDPAYFAPSLVTFVDGLQAGVSDDAGPDSGTALTEWAWPNGLATAEEGSIEVTSAEPGVPLTVTVEGEDIELEPGGPLTLPPGTYTLVARADEHEAMQVTREILPGTGTRVAFGLVPILTDEVSERVSESVVGLRTSAEVCRNGVGMRDGFVVTSLSSLGGATEVEVLRAGRLPIGGAVVGTDPAADLAVVTVDDLGVPALPAADQLAGSRFGWSVFRSGCDPALAVSRVRLDDAGQAATAIPPAAVGAPLIDRGGSLLGLVTTGGAISPLERVGDLLEEAAQQLDRGGFPTVWVALGAAALGGAAALLLGGRDNGPDTGSIVISLPSN